LQHIPIKEGNLVSKRYYKKNAWWVSPFNEVPEVAKQILPSGRVELHDITLRDWGRSYGVVYSASETRRITEMLIEIGIERIEIGLPDSSGPDQEAVKKICESSSDTDIYTYIRNSKKEIDQAAACGMDGVVISVPIGYPRLRHQLNWTWENALEKSVDFISHAKSQQLKTIFAPYDATRARPEDLENLLKGIAKSAEPDELCVEDTTGCALPQTLQYLVKKSKQLLRGVPVQVHTHNDFGLAVSGALSAAAAGAQVLCTCTNGLGSRLGSAPLEEVVLCLKILLGLGNEYNMEKLLELCLLVEELSGIPIGANKPFGGYRSYISDDAGFESATSHPLIRFATDPRYFGRNVQMVPEPKDEEKRSKLRR